MGGPGGGRERGALVAASVAKFRGAIRLRPEFDRACYNLGTVYYSHAHALQAAAQSALSSQLTKARRLTPQVARAFQGFQGVLGLGFQVPVNAISDSCCGCAAHHARQGSMARWRALYTRVLGSNRAWGLVAQDAARQRAEQAEAADIVHAFCQAAQYIALAYALQPGRDIYQRSLKVWAGTAGPHGGILKLLPHAAPVLCGSVQL